MDNKIEQLWESYQVQSAIFDKKKIYKDINSSFSEVMSNIFNIIGDEKSKDFVTLLYDYMKMSEKISFEVGYSLGKNK